VDISRNASKWQWIKASNMLDSNTVVNAGLETNSANMARDQTMNAT
jgi:hypothetical protein